MHLWIVRTKGKVSGLMETLFRQMEHRHTTRIPSPMQLLMRSPFPGCFPSSAKIWSHQFLNPASLLVCRSFPTCECLSVQVRHPAREDGECLGSQLFAFHSLPDYGHAGPPPTWSEGVEQTRGAAGLRREGCKPRVKESTMGTLPESLHPRREKKTTHTLS